MACWVQNRGQVLFLFLGGHLNADGQRSSQSDRTGQDRRRSVDQGREKRPDRKAQGHRPLEQTSQFTLQTYAMLNSRFLFVSVALLAFVPILRAAETSQAASAAIADDRVPRLVVGQTAPPIDALDAGSKQRRLSGLRGKRALLLTFFPKCFTGNCTNQVISLRDSYDDLQKLGVEVWAVSTDSADGPHGQRAFADEYKLPFALLPDTDRKICMVYGAVQSKEQMAARMSVFIDKDGKVTWIDKQINPRTHGADVLARIKEAQAKPSEK